MKKMRKGMGKWIALCSVLLVLVGIFLIGYSPNMKVVYYELESEKMEDTVRIVLISDLHSCRYGEQQRELIDAVAEQAPDLVLLCGDIFDDKIPHDNALLFVEAVAQRYPCYYVSGNHEYYSGEVEEIKQMVRETGTQVLEGDCCRVQVGEQFINICGVDDPTRIGLEEMKRQIAQAWEASRQEEYTLLLSHRPELAEIYEDFGFDLVLAGHAHGGQWRIPGIINGIYAPHEGFFPKYAGGEYALGDTVMIVSRGLARESTRMPRMFNPPELVVIDIA